MKKVIVASTNPVKIESTQIGFAKMFPDESFDVQGVSAPSEISAQPMSSDETLLGATNRVRNVSDLVSAVDYWVGIEGGIEDAHEELEVFAWVVEGCKRKNWQRQNRVIFSASSHCQTCTAGNRTWRSG